MATAKIKFQEYPCFDGRHLTTPLKFKNGKEWSPVISCPAQFPLELFQSALMTLIHHPEYNSSLILRSETISETEIAHHNLEVPNTNILFGYTPVYNIHRRILPRRPVRDAPLEQDCTYYASKELDIAHPSVLILTPRLFPGEQLPYYHPSVSHLAFRYVTLPGENQNNANQIIIETVPLPDTSLDLTSRLYRTCLALLETVDRYGWGAMTNYCKRVVHDVIIPRNEYQDLYIIMKERHKPLVGAWQESTDPLKHVYEDVGIATFLILLWKVMYPERNVDDLEHPDLNNLEHEPWHRWGRPPGGFVDIGCGNGVLTHILLSEGYLGEGFDLRPRISWSHYPEATQKHLHLKAFNPHEPNPYLRPSAFLIGNHADELTPWIPVLATLLPASGYLSIPCCAWDFDTRFERGRTGTLPVPQFERKSGEHERFIRSIGLGVEGQTTSYAMYRIWLAYLSKACGWKVECEMLRIPSTRNWAIIGREFVDQINGKQFVERIFDAVRERGIFEARAAQGKVYQWG